MPTTTRQSASATSGGLTLIASEDLGFAPVDMDVRIAFREALRKIEEAGNKIRYDNPGLTSSASTWANTATYDIWQHKGATSSSAEQSRVE